MMSLPFAVSSGSVLGGDLSIRKSTDLQLRRRANAMGCCGRRKQGVLVVGGMIFIKDRTIPRCIKWAKRKSRSLRA